MLNLQLKKNQTTSSRSASNKWLVRSSRGLTTGLSALSPFMNSLAKPRKMGSFLWQHTTRTASKPKKSWSYWRSFCLLMSFAALQAGCLHHKSSPLPPPQMTHALTSQQTRTLSSFSSVNVQGRINLNLHTGYKTPRILLKGDPRDLAQVQTKIHNNVLYITLGVGFPQYGQVSADVRGSVLRQLRYEGAGLVTGNQLNSRFLDLYLANQGTTRLGGSLGIQHLTVEGNSLVQLTGVNSYSMHVRLIGTPKVQVTGMANLAELTIDGGGWFSLYWVKSTNLTIKAKHAAKIQLAGIVNRLDLELWDTAQFKGRYLRAQRSFVKTHGKSVAEITTVNHQSSLATDASDIYYFNIPNTRADFMGFDGSTLDMRDLSSPFMDEEYTRYNKHFP